MTIAERLKAARAALSLTQEEAARKFELPLGSLRKYESGPSQPGSSRLAGMVRGGINANWLLTGEGPMRLADLRPKASGEPDATRLLAAIETVEQGLAVADTTIGPIKRAELVMAVYDLLEAPGVTRERVLKLVRLSV